MRVKVDRLTEIERKVAGAQDVWDYLVASGLQPEDVEWLIARVRELEALMEDVRRGYEDALVRAYSHGGAADGGPAGD